MQNKASGTSVPSEHDQPNGHLRTSTLLSHGEAAVGVKHIWNDVTVATQLVHSEWYSWCQLRCQWIGTLNNRSGASQPGRPH